MPLSLHIGKHYDPSPNNIPIFFDPESSLAFLGKYPATVGCRYMNPYPKTPLAQPTSSGGMMSGCRHTNTYPKHAQAQPLF